MIRIIMICAGLLTLAGCASMLTPGDWKTEFSCSETGENKGKCASVQVAYAEFLKSQDKEKAAPQSSDALESSFRVTMLQEQLKIMKNPVKPIRIPEKIQRTLLFSYTEGDDLYAPQWAWYKLEDGRYLLGDYLNDGGR